MKGKKRIIIIAVAIVLVLAAVGTAVFFLLPKDKGETKPEEIKVDFPSTYKLNDIEIPALEYIPDEPTDSEESAESEEEPEEDKKADSKENKEEDASEETDESEENDASKPSWEQESISASYVYHNFPNLLESITQYVAKMTGGKGYFAVDENMQKKKATAAESSEGTCSLARKGDQEGMLFHIKITWSGAECSVVASYMPGEITEPKQSETSNYTEMKKAITILEAKEFIWSLPPSVLGLEGDNMNSYQIYTNDVDVIVDGYPCIRLNIFEKDDGSGTNVPVGEYCLSRNGENLYRIEKASNSVQKIDLPADAAIQPQ